MAPASLTITLLGWFTVASATDAETLLRQGRLIEALEVAANDVAEHPEDVAVQELAIDVFLSLGQVDRAVNHARERIAVAPEAADSHYLLGRAEVDPQASRAAYARALELDPEHPRAHMGLGSLDEVAGAVGAAQIAYQRAVSRDPSLAEAWVGLARTYLTDGHRDKAREVALDGFNRTKAPGLALLLATLDPAGANEVLAEALTANGSSVVLHNAMARTALLRGDPALAEQQAQQALVIDPNSVDARATYHWARELGARRIDRATMTPLISPTTTGQALVRAHERALVAAPRSAMARFSRAWVRQASNDAGYVDDLVRATEIDPSNDLVASAAGDALLAAGRGAEAIAPLTRAVSARPWDRGPALSLARALRVAGHRTDALLLLERVASAHPRHVDTQLLYAQTLIDLGRTRQAYAVTKVAMLAQPDPRLIAAFVQVAPLAGQPGEAASVLEPIAQRTNNTSLKAAVVRLRKLAEAQEP